MSTYRSKLDKARKQALDILSLVIAQEIDESSISVSLSPEQFEDYCSIVNDAHISTGCPVTILVDIVCEIHKSRRPVSMRNVKDKLYQRGF
jgi:hypothetical protein